jgi:hypothetical protein
MEKYRIGYLRRFLVFLDILAVVTKVFLYFYHNKTRQLCNDKFAKNDGFIVLP